MTVDRVLNVAPGCESVAAVKVLLEWQKRQPSSSGSTFRSSVLVLVTVPGDAASGTVYILDRKPGTWCRIDFEDKQYGGYTLRELQQLLSECNLLRLIEKPELLRGRATWTLERGQDPAAKV